MGSIPTYSRQNPPEKVLFGGNLNVGDRIFLEGLNRETSYPYIIYSYSVMPELGTKDGGMDNCQVIISIFSKDGGHNLSNPICFFIM